MLNFANRDDAPVTRKPYTSAHLRALTPKIAWVTPQMAKHLLETCAFERQRALSFDHISRLANEMRNGWFLEGTPIWLCVLPDRSMVIVNGNHTLSAVARGNFPVPLTFMYHQVRDLDHAAHVYATFDIHRVRTWANAAKAAGLDKEIPMMNKALGAIGHMLTNFGQRTMDERNATRSRETRFAYARKYARAIAGVAAAIAETPKAHQKFVQRSANLSVAIATMHYQPSVATEFWRGLALDDGLPSTDPRKALLNYMRKNKVAAGGTHEDSLAVSLAWNAFFRNEKLTMLKPAAVKSFRLLGTRWHDGIEKAIAAEDKEDARAAEAVAEDVEPSAAGDFEMGAFTNGDGTKSPVTIYNEVAG